MNRLWAASRDGVTTLSVILGALLLWEIGVWIFHPPPIILPPPSLVVQEFFHAPGYFLRQAGFTLYTTVTGFVLAMIIGLALAIGIVYSRFLERTIYTLLVALNSVPKVALAPLFVIWMGIDTVLGLRSVDPDMINLAKISRANSFAVLWKIRLPNALPFIFAGLKVGISFALVGAIVGEFVGGSDGLGFAIVTAQGQFDTPRVFVCLFTLGIVGTLLFYAIEGIERLALPWHVSQRGAVDAR